MNITEQQAIELYERLGKTPASFRMAAGIAESPATPSKRKRPTYDGPLDVTLVLHGHCPSKKNGWRMAGDRMVIPSEMKKQIEALMFQAMIQWKIGRPVEHPDVTVKFFVCAARQDEDGMWTTALDCMQKAGVIVNDNIKHFNGRKIHEPCQFVELADERVEIRLEKK